jgi:hypothetical protein
MQRSNTSLTADIVKGALAGATAVWVMDQVGWFLYRREDPRAVLLEKKARVKGIDVAHVAANKMATAFGAKLSPRQPNPAGIAVHYALGIIPGALYGPLRHRVPGISSGRGLVYGLGLFLLNDEMIAPLLGLASGPTAYPWQAHARGLISHLVVGAATHAGIDALDQVT